MSGRSGSSLSGRIARCAAAFTPSDLTGNFSSSHVRKLESIIGSGVGYAPVTLSNLIGSDSSYDSGCPSSTSSISLTPSKFSRSSVSDSSSQSWISSRFGSGVMLTSSIASSSSLISISEN